MADIDLQRVHDAMVEIAFAAGKMMLESNVSQLDQGTKINSVDLVTECDKAVEAMVSSRLSAEFPAFAFLGEETYKPGMKLTATPTFVVDPIDGTTNFVHGFPYACISLGFAVERAPVVGVVYNPWADTLYTAIKGRGAFVRTPRNTFGRPAGPGEESHQTRRLPLSGPDAPPLGGLGTAMVAVDWGYSRDDANFHVKEELFRKLATTPAQGGAMVHGMRFLGSAALNICTVAAGGLDLYWEGGCWAWDVCAGWAILSEAGGLMVGGNPGEWTIEVDSRIYLAVRPAAGGRGQREIVQEFWGHMGEGRLEYSS